jgi:hypothetical protein
MGKFLSLFSSIVQDPLYQLLALERLDRECSWTIVNSSGRCAEATALVLSVCPLAVNSANVIVVIVMMLPAVTPRKSQSA